jgi:UDP-N-acetylmuramate dehydrogenase
MREERNVLLAPLTTLRVGGPATRLVHCETEDELVQVVRDADATQQPLLILGGGSNVLIADEGFAGIVALVRTRGIRQRTGPEQTTFDVAAGEDWDAFVEHTLREGCRGFECLSCIPGSVGAGPMQNIGAYGQEIGSSIVAVRVFDRDTDTVRELSREACGFAYRDSLFKRERAAKDDTSSRYVVLGVRFCLPRAADSVELTYKELYEHLGVAKGARAPLPEVRQAIRLLRAKKGMVLDPQDPDSVSAGSFFMNPVLDDVALAALQARVAQVLGPDARVPTFPEGKETKVAAAWLIEQAGFHKGSGAGPARISGKHCLALVNRFGATAADLVQLAEQVQQGVFQRFGVWLHNEPVCVGVEVGRRPR